MAPVYLLVGICAPPLRFGTRSHVHHLRWRPCNCWLGSALLRSASVLDHTCTIFDGARVLAGWDLRSSAPLRCSITRAPSSRRPCNCWLGSALLRSASVLDHTCTIFDGA